MIVTCNLSSHDILLKQKKTSKCRASSRSKLFDTLMVFLKEYFSKKVDFEKNQQTYNYPVGKEFCKRNPLIAELFNFSKVKICV